MEKKKGTLKIVIADDHGIVREGLKQLFDNEKDLEVVAQASNGYQAIETVQQTLPDIVIMDITMPGLNGIEATKKIKNLFSDIKVIMLSVHKTKSFIFESFKAGASAYLPKESLFSELKQAITVVTDGKNYISPSITSLMINDYIEQSGNNHESAFSKLTDREVEILQMLSEGHSSKEIAFKLELSVKTIDATRKHVMDKLNKHSLAELTKYAIKEGLTTIE